MKQIGLTLVTVALTLLLLEYCAKQLLRPDQLYSRIHANPERHEWHNEVEFWSRYHDLSERRGMPFRNFDPVLGWDFDRSGDRIRGTVAPFPGSADRRRILLIGDSFTYGTDVEPDENFGSLLAARSDEFEVLNMAIPGYGIDQAYLKFRHFGAALEPDVVVFGIYVSDYERSSLAFTTFAKPRFRLRDQILTLENQPVPQPEVELARIGAALSGRIYLWELLQNTWHKMRATRDSERAFFDETDPVITGILTSLLSELATEQRLLIVQFPRAEAFIEEDSFRDEMASRLLAVYRRLDLSVIDLQEAFLRNHDGNAVYQTHYVHFDDGSVGHLSPLGHQRVADLVSEALSPDLPDVVGPAPM